MDNTIVENMLKDALEVIPCTNYDPTGSRVFGDFTDKSDYDYLVLVEKGCDLDEVKSKLTEGEWFESCAKGQYWGTNELIVRTKYRGVDLNLIITKDKKYYEDWFVVGDLAKRLGLSKSARKELYRLAFTQRKVQ